MLAPVKPSRLFRRLNFREQGGVRSESHGGLVRPRGNVPNDSAARYALLCNRAPPIGAGHVSPNS